MFDLKAQAAAARRTKIVCTLGPASEDRDTLAAMMAAGMDVARFNVSHGTHEQHLARLGALREAEQQAGRRVAVLWDLRGPEIRLLLPGGRPLEVKAGDLLELFDTTWPGLADVLEHGQRVLLADGAVVAQVEAASAAGGGGGRARPMLRFLSSGSLRERSKVAVPGVKPDLPPLSDQDLADIRLGAEAGADVFAMSFVHDARDLLELRDRLRALDSTAATIAKIETLSAYRNLRGILAVSDGAMVARGDLGVECPFEEIPLMQKEILAACNRLGKPGITATEMLESMIRQPRPTRAEASDVFNAVLDGTDALMLSAETAIGQYPVETVATMHRIAVEAEQLAYQRWTDGRHGLTATEPLDGNSPAPVAIAGAAVWASATVGASAIITPTRSGYTARMVARLRPGAPVIAVSPDERTVNVLRLSWGVTALHRRNAEGPEDTVETSLDTAIDAGLVANGDLVVITAGVPSGVPGTTNMLQLRTIGEILARGVGIAAGAAEAPERGVVSGELCVVSDASELEGCFVDGCILAAPATDAGFVPYMRRAAAVIVADAGLSSHTAVVGLSLGKPVVLGIRDVEELPHGQVVTVDAARGVIYRGRVRTA